MREPCYFGLLWVAQGRGTYPFALRWHIGAGNLFLGLVLDCTHVGNQSLHFLPVSTGVGTLSRLPMPMSTRGGTVSLRCMQDCAVGGGGGLSLRYVLVSIRTGNVSLRRVLLAMARTLCLYGVLVFAGVGTLSIGFHDLPCVG